MLRAVKVWKNLRKLRTVGPQLDITSKPIILSPNLVLKITPIYAGRVCLRPYMPAEYVFPCRLEF